MPREFRVGDRITWRSERFSSSGPTGILDLVEGVVVDVSPSGKFYRVRSEDGAQVDVSASWVLERHTINIAINFDASEVDLQAATERVAVWLAGVHPDELPAGVVDIHMVSGGGDDGKR